MHFQLQRKTIAGTFCLESRVFLSDSRPIVEETLDSTASYQSISKLMTSPVSVASPCDGRCGFSAAGAANREGQNRGPGVSRSSADEAVSPRADSVIFVFGHENTVIILSLLGTNVISIEKPGYFMQR